MFLFVLWYKILFLVPPLQASLPTLQPEVRGGEPYLVAVSKWAESVFIHKLNDGTLS